MLPLALLSHLLDTFETVPLVLLSLPFQHVLGLGELSQTLLFGAFAQVLCLASREAALSQQTVTKETKEPFIWSVERKKRFFLSEGLVEAGAVIDCAFVYQNGTSAWSLCLGLLWAGSQAKEAQEKGVVLEPT